MKVYGRKLSLLNLRYYHLICLEIQKMHENLNRDGWSSRQDVNTWPPEYEAQEPRGHDVR
jgi:hypothetical protein